MGNFEKLVVLTVLFLSAIVLAISLNDGKKKAEHGSPMDLGRQASLDPASRAASGDTRRPGQATNQRDLLLSTEVLPEASAPRGASEAVLPRGRDGRAPILVVTGGLRKAGLDDYMVYTAAAEDTWTALSERFYGSGRHVSLLRHANEDMVSPTAGETILVPVYDFSSEAGRRAPLTPAARPGAAPQESASYASAQRPTIERPQPATGSSTPVAAQDPGPGVSGATRAGQAAGADLSTVTEVTVGPGDSLSGIALRVYGSAARWNVLYEANRSVLRSPDWLQVGTRLSVPRGAALQALQSASAAPASGAGDQSVASGAGDKKGKVR